jgi:ABC-type spermidine/putrescine transport system permease subunit II
MVTSLPMTEPASTPVAARQRPLFDPILWLVAPAALFLLSLFIYPFLYGLVLSFQPRSGGWLANYLTFFSTENLWRTLFTTLDLALPATLINVGLALPIAYKLRVKSRYQRWVTTILVVPIALGTVLIAEGMLTYFGPRGWLAQALSALHLYDGTIRLTHNYWGVLISLSISGFPFVFLLMLSYISGIDPGLARAAATLGASPWQQFRRIYLPLVVPGLSIAFCLAFVQAFSVFPSAVLLGAPAGPTRVISIAAYEAAFERYDYSMASSIAMIMGFSQLAIVGLVFGARRLFYRGPVVLGGAIASSGAAPHDPSWYERAWSALVAVVVSFFLLNIALMCLTVLVNSLGTRWLGSWLPDAWTGNWYFEAWKEFALGDVLWVTIKVVLAVVLLSILIGVPAAYALARRDFLGKRALLLLFLLPLMVPPITYGIPLATVMYRAHLAGTINGVILANLIPALPFVILVMVPFIEQIDPRLEQAARVLGASTGSVFWHILSPLLAPGILAASLLVMVRTIAMFELTFLTAGSDSQTLVVALYYAVFAAGVRASQSVDAMAMVYMTFTLLWLLVALQFVNPTQLVSRVREAPRD